MKLLKTIRDSDLGLANVQPTSYTERTTARAIVFDTEKNVAFLHVTKKKFHKLPGGGVEGGEDLMTALARELREEIGCSVQNIRDLGMIEEYRGIFEEHQISYCFIADLLGKKGEPNFMQDEIEDGFEIVWMNLEDAIRTLESEKEVEDYEGKFIRVRDLAFLQVVQG